MASLWNRPESKYWWACYIDREGKRRKRSTHQTDRRKAQKVADDLEAIARARITSRKVRETMARVHCETTGEVLSVSTLRAYVEQWVERKRTEVAAGTLDHYKSRIEKFVDFLGPNADRQLDEITRAQVEKYRNTIAAKLSPKTANNDLKVLRMLFRAARSDTLIAEDPSEFVSPVRDRGDAEGGRQPFTLPQLQSVLAVCDDEWRSIVLCSFYLGGQRLGDLAMLLRSNVRLDRGDVKFRTRKTGRWMLLPLALPLRRHFEALPKSDSPQAPLHPRAFEIVKRTGKAAQLSNQFGLILAAAGLREARTHIGRDIGRDAPRRKEDLSFHSLRHTATSLLHDAGLPPTAVQSFVGHDDAASHDGYVHVDRASLERTAAALPDLTKRP